MGNLENLNLNVEEEAKNTQSFDALPSGEYEVVITDAKMEANKSGAGSHISIKMEIIEGDFAQRLIWENFNIENSNPQAEKIGRASLSSCCLAMGIDNPRDTDELKDIPFRINLGLDRKDPTKNRIKSYIHAGAPAEKSAAKPDAKVVAPVAKQAAAPAATGVKPWQRKK